MTKPTHTVTRREFIRQMACASLELTGVVNSMSFLRLTNAAVLQGELVTTQSDDYKALVYIYLSGGNDANNMLVPMGNRATHPIRADYEDTRGTIALDSADLHPLTIPGQTRAFQKHYGGGQYAMGIHPSAEPLATLFNQGDLAFVCNVGSLLYPIPDRESYIKQLVTAPPKLFSHNSQEMQWQTSIPDQVGAVGWGGRLADLMHAGYNGDSAKASISFSLNGLNTFQRGMLPETAAFSIGTDGIMPLYSFGEGYAHAVQPGNTLQNPIYQESPQGHRLETLETLFKLSNDNLLQNSYASKFISAREVEDTVGGAIALAESSPVDFDTYFADATTSLGDQLKMIAKLIAGRSAIGNRRQIFYAQVNGYDAHNNVLASHAPLMEELALSLQAFRDTLVAAGEWDNVVAFTGSDFGRTLSPNTSGTDHAWGGHAIVLGGPVNGGNLYGHYPPLKTGEHPDSMDAKSRGLIIPTTSVDQYSAPLAKWFGADANSMETIFPNLPRFDDPFASTTANLGFLAGL